MVTEYTVGIAEKKREVTFFQETLQNIGNELPLKLQTTESLSVNIPINVLLIFPLPK